MPRRRGSRCPKDGPKGAAVTVLKAVKSCFSNIVEVSGILIAKQETAVRPERPGLKVAEIQAEAGDSVTAGQILARLTLPEGGSVQARSQNQIGDARNSANPALSLQVRIRGA